MFRSIQWRIAIPYVLLILAAMGILGFYLVEFVRDARIRDLSAQLHDEARLIAEASLTLFSDPPGAAPDQLAKRLSERIEARITVIAADGTVLGDSHEDPSTMENHGDRPEVQEALATGRGESRRYSSTLRENMLYVAVPIVVGGNPVGVARVALPTTEVDTSARDLQRNVGIAMAIATACAALVAVLIARRTTRPIKTLTAAAKRMASGQLDQKIYPDTRDETAELASAFNEMAASLNVKMDALQTETNKLAAVLSTMADGVVMTDIRGTVILANKAAGNLFDFDPARAPGRRLAELIPDHEVSDLFKSHLRTGRQQAGQIEQLSKGRLLRLIVSPVSYHSAVGALLMFQDLTEVRRLQTIRQKFIGNISHELRTPLASIKAVVETLKEGGIDDKEVARTFLSSIETETDRMTQTVRELAELSRIETGQIKISPEPMSIPELVGEVMATLQPQAERKRVELSSRVAADTPMVLGEKERIGQVLTNLTHNAVKFTPAGGQVTISATPEEHSVTISVADTGVGILPKDLPHVFERFYKADEARASEGSGLGLAIAKHIIHAHGGEIWAESEPGHGSTFRFRLPRAT